MAQVTQEMIARKLGISRTAVACGLGLYRGKTVSLPDGTRQLIVQTARQMGYRPNRFAQRVAGRATGVIGVMSFGGISQIAVQRVREISRAIQEAGYDLLLYEVAWYQRENVSGVVEALMDNHVEAVILIEPTIWFDFSAVQIFGKNSVPVVSLGGVQRQGIPSVAADEYAGMWDLTLGLMARGAKYLALLSPLYSKPETRPMIPVFQRGRAFVDGIEKQGGKMISAPSRKFSAKGPVGELVDASSTTDWDDPYEPGYTAMAVILAKKVLPDVVLCLNDDWAFGALRRCREEGIRVPEDLWVSGNDGTTISAYGGTPPTTIVQPLDQMAMAAVQLVQRLLKGEKLAAGAVVQKFAPRVEWRCSTGA